MSKYFFLELLLSLNTVLGGFKLNREPHGPPQKQSLQAPLRDKKRKTLDLTGGGDSDNKRMVLVSTVCGRILAAAMDKYRG